MNQSTFEIVGFLSAFFANLVIWFGRDYLPTDVQAKKLYQAAILIISTLAVYFMITLVMQPEQITEAVNLVNMLEAMLAAFGINLGADVLFVQPKNEIGIQSVRRSRFRSIVS